MSLWGKELRAIQERFTSLAWLRTICFLPPAADCKDASAQLVQTTESSLSFLGSHYPGIYLPMMFPCLNSRSMFLIKLKKKRQRPRAEGSL